MALNIGLISFIVTKRIVGGLYPSHTRIESGINNISRVYHGIVHMVTLGKRGRFRLNEITQDIFKNSRPYSGGGANVLSRDKACN